MALDFLHVRRGFGHALEVASKELKQHHSYVLAAVRHNGHTLKYAPKEMQNDRSIVLAAVKESGMALVYASNALKGDIDIVLLACKEDIQALEYASSDLKSNARFFLDIVKIDGCALWYASEELKGNAVIVQEAVKQNGFALESASEEMRDNPEVVKKAVMQNGYALMYASIELKGESGIVIHAVKQNGHALKHMSKTMEKNSEISLEAVKQNGHALGSASKEMKCTPRIIFEAAKQTVHALEYVSMEMKDDLQFILLLSLEMDAEVALKFASGELKTHYRTLKHLVAHEQKGVLRSEVLLVAAYHGFIQLAAACFRGRQIFEVDQLVRYTTGNALTPLHLAARGGHVEVCRLLLRHGSPLRTKGWKTPIALAKRARQRTVVKLLNDHSIRFKPGSRGDALGRCFLDVRKVSALGWFIVPFLGVTGYLGALHSLLVVTVSEKQGQIVEDVDDSLHHQYVIEKVLGGPHALGVIISNWNDMRIRILKEALHYAEAKHLVVDVTMRELYCLATSAGPYNVGTNNCHHMVQHLFNHCVVPSKAATLPNARLARMSRAADYLGINLARIGIGCNMRGGSIMLGSQMESVDLYNDGALMLIEPNCPEEPHAYAEITCQLSMWIYEPNVDTVTIHNDSDTDINLFIASRNLKLCLKPGCKTKVQQSSQNTTENPVNDDSSLLKVAVQKRRRNSRKWGQTREIFLPLFCSFVLREVSTCDDEELTADEFEVEESPDISLPPNVTVEHVTLMDGKSCLQWAILTSTQAIYVVFKGTKHPLDAIIDIGFLPNDENPTGLGLHAHMWGAMHQKRNHAADTIAFKLEALRQRSEWGNQENPPQLVICGHSLGGGYAVLAALDLLHRGTHLTSVVTFGAPQVLVPQYDHRLWQQLDCITKQYINEWDIIPRMPMCKNWYSDVLLPIVLSMKKGPLQIRFSKKHMEKLNKGVSNFVEQMADVCAGYDSVGALLFVSIQSSEAHQMSSSPANKDARLEFLSKVPPSTGLFLIDLHKLYLSVIRNLRRYPAN
uniref:Fungal lipase-like domain-containing protein n=1 Tax=Octactis speculum TaxID=3111310 RepID=A0A7S2AUD3_9STRA